VQRCSGTIGAIAGALAKAQAELTNPEKSLVATIIADGPSGVERSFRYAPLSSGLEIVRKTLSQHEIATVQTTAVDKAAGIVNLMTVSAHSSVRMDCLGLAGPCHHETATAQRMGAALTYARRYGSFHLSGICTRPTSSGLRADKPMLHQNSSPEMTANATPHRGQEDRSLTPRSRPPRLYSALRPQLPCGTSLRPNSRTLARPRKPQRGRIGCSAPKAV
jgi:hypothetical protein